MTWKSLLCCAALILLQVGAAQGDQPQGWPIKPKQMEQEIWAHLQANQDLGFTSIERVKCNKTDCEIRFVGPDPVNDYATLNRLVTDFMARMSRERQIKIRQASSSKAEISPGVQGVIVRLSSRAPSASDAAVPQPTEPPKTADPSKNE